MARVFVAGLYLASLFLPGFCAEDYYKILVRWNRVVVCLLGAGAKASRGLTRVMYTLPDP